MNKNHFLLPLIFFGFLQTILPAQKQFGRIFIENANPLINKNTKVNNEKEQSKIIISQEVPDTMEASVKHQIEFLPSISKIENLFNLDKKDSIKSINNNSIVNAQMKNLKKLKYILPADSITTKKGLIYRIDTNEEFSGSIVDKWENSNNKIEIIVKDGLKHGTLKEWFSNGQKMTTSTWNNGELHGSTRNWYENAQLKSKGKYLFGKKYEAWFNFFENGQIDKEVNYSDGMINGLISRWYSNGQQKEKGIAIKQQLSDNHLATYNKTGVWTEWYLNGQKKELKNSLKKLV